MKAWFLMSVLLAAGSTHARDAAQGEHELLRTEAAVCRAFETGDAAYLRTALDPRFTLIDSRGVVTNLEQNLAEVRMREPHYDEFRNHDQAIRLYGDTAIVTGITSIKGTTGGDAFAADFRFTDTWVYRGKRWILAASHASRLPAP